MNFEQFRTKEEAIEYIRQAESTHCRTARQAEKYLADHLPKESYYQKKIMDRIRALVPDAFIWKAAAGPYGRGGIPDICAVINGRFYGFEVKRPFIGEPSKLQLETMKQIRAAGGQAHVVSWPDDVDRILSRCPENAGKD